MADGIEINQNQLLSFLVPKPIYNLSNQLVDPVTQDTLIAIKFLEEIKKHQETGISESDLVLRALEIFYDFAQPKPASIIPITSARGNKPKTIKRKPSRRNYP